MSKWFCPECESELKSSNSERGAHFCTECMETRGYKQALELCPCCKREGTLGRYGHYDLCDTCADFGCDPILWYCPYTQATTDPSECDHSFFQRVYTGGIECRYCGYVTAGGPRPNDYGESWPGARQSALERDGHLCQLCGMGQSDHRGEHDVGLHVHHIQPYRSFNSDDGAHQLDNLVTLCKDCHKKLEPLSEDEQRDRLDESEVTA